MTIEELFDDETIPYCDSVWVLSLLLILMNDKKSDTIINIYINGDKVGE